MTRKKKRKRGKDFLVYFLTIIYIYFFCNPHQDLVNNGRVLDFIIILSLKIKIVVFFCGRAAVHPLVSFVTLMGQQLNIFFKKGGYMMMKQPHK